MPTGSELPSVRSQRAGDVREALWKLGHEPFAALTEAARDDLCGMPRPERTARAGPGP
jgi:hypothetical protein